jgi:peptide-methionine (S)-S-oxide reductase
MKMFIQIAVLLSLSMLSCSRGKALDINETIERGKESNMKIDTATFGAGCFWCVESVFQELDGVVRVESGYMGGHTANPNYKDVCSGETGHAEVCRIEFDSSRISFEELLEVFWQTHDPTTLSRQGNDIGTQYRSVIFYNNEDQKKSAEYYKNKLNESGAFKNTIVTEISPVSEFYIAEDYHQDYFENNPNQPYCSFVIKPKLDKFRKAFQDKLRK